MLVNCIHAAPLTAGPTDSSSGSGYGYCSKFAGSAFAPTPVFELSTVALFPNPAIRSELSGPKAFAPEDKFLNPALSATPAGFATAFAGFLFLISPFCPLRLMLSGSPHDL